MLTVPVTVVTALSAPLFSGMLIMIWLIIGFRFYDVAEILLCIKGKSNSQLGYRILQAYLQLKLLGSRTRYITSFHRNLIPDALNPALQVSQSDSLVKRTTHIAFLNISKVKLPHPSSLSAYSEHCSAWHSTPHIQVKWKLKSGRVLGAVPGTPQVGSSQCPHLDKQVTCRWDV